LGFLQLNKEEQRLFSQVRYVDYATTACRVEGLEGHRAYAAVLDGEDIVDPSGDAPVLLMRTHEASNVAIVYSFSETRRPLSDIEASIHQCMEAVGGQVLEILETRRWKYFPHVDSQAMAAGFFDQVEALQGTQQTFYTGGQLDFDIVEGAISYSRHLVDHYFP